MLWKKFYFAPLEGISGYVYRKAYEHYFGGIDKYFIPFIKPNQKGKLSSRGKRTISYPCTIRECARFRRF